MPPESLLEELNHEEPTGIHQTKGDGGAWGGGGAEVGRERQRQGRQRKCKVKRSVGKKECRTFHKLQSIYSG